MKTDVDTCLREMADFYIKNRRSMTEPELEAILQKHCVDAKEIRSFAAFLGTEPGQSKFKTLLRERKGESGGTGLPARGLLPPQMELTGWVYAKVGMTEVRGRRVPTGIDIEQVSPSFNQVDFDKAVRIIEERLAGEKTGMRGIRIGPSYLKEPFIKVGERVRFIGSSRGRYGNWPEGKWLEYGVTGKVTEYHPEQAAVRVGGEYFEALPPYAVVNWDLGGEAKTVINPEDEGSRWERITAESYQTEAKVKVGLEVRMTRDISADLKKGDIVTVKEINEYGDVWLIKKISPRETADYGWTRRENVEPLASYLKELKIKLTPKQVDVVHFRFLDIGYEWVKLEGPRDNSYLIIPPERVKEALSILDSACDITRDWHDPSGIAEHRATCDLYEKVKKEAGLSKPSYLKEQFKIPKTRVSSLGFLELEVPVARAVEALVEENPWSSGFHGALNQRWTIVFKGKISDRAVNAAKVAGLEVSYREAPVGSGQILTDVSLPGVGISEIEKATEVFNRFAELYEGAISGKYKEQPKLARLPKFHGRAWRVEYTHLGIPANATAGDVIRFEKEELGNDYGLSRELISELDKYSANDIIWVTKTRADAKKYLSEGRPESDITEVEGLEGGRIVAEDGEGGYLVLKPTPSYLKERLDIGKKVQVSPHNITQGQLLDVLNKVPDVNDTGRINYWVDVGDKKVYIEGWCNKCIAGWGYPKRDEEGAYETFFEVGERLTPYIIERKATDNPFNEKLKLLEGGWVGTPDAKNLYGITYGIYGKPSYLKESQKTDDAATWWDGELSVVKFHALVELGLDRKLVSTQFAKLAPDVAAKLRTYYSNMGRAMYTGGWKPGDKAIYTDFGLRSLYIVQVLPPRIVRPGEGTTPGEMAGGDGVLAQIIDTSLANWDFPWAGQVPDWNKVGTIHIYNYTNLYRDIDDLIAFERRTGYAYVMDAIVDGLHQPENWQVLVKYGLAKQQPIPKAQIPLNWYEKLFTEMINGEEFYRVKNYFPVGWPHAPRIEMTESSIAKDTYRDWQERARGWTFETWKVDVWKMAGKPIGGEIKGGGTCYQDALRFLLKEEEGFLVHGSVETEGKRTGHAWVETLTGFIYEPEHKVFFEKEEFKKAAKPIEQNRYTLEQASIISLRTKNHGPWSEEERKAFLRPSYLKEPLLETECQIISPRYFDILGWLNIPVPDYSFAIEAEVKERKIDEVLEKLKNGVASIQESAIFREFLLTMSKFHQYSIGNQILIMIQRKDATRVAGIRTWNELGRFVKAGEHGIAILAPCLPPPGAAVETWRKPDGTEYRLRPLGGAKWGIYSKGSLIEVYDKKIDAERWLIDQGAEKVRAEEMVPTPTYFKVVYVFDVAQTQGKPLPEIVVPVLSGAYSEELYNKLIKLAKKYDLTIQSEPRPGQDPQIKGMLLAKTIWIRPEEPEAQRLKTLAHEEAHYFTENVYFIPHADAEVIAESVAFVVGAHFGFDSGVRSFPYVALWAKEKKVLEQNLASIRKISGRMIEEVEK